MILKISKILALYLLCTIIKQVEGLISPTSNYGLTSTNYAVSIFDFGVTAKAGSKIKIKFPFQFSAEALHKAAPYSGYDVAKGDFCPSNCGIVTIQYEAYTFTLNNMFTTATNPIFQYTIKNIPNPLPGGTNGFEITVVETDGTIVYT